MYTRTFNLSTVFTLHRLQFFLTSIPSQFFLPGLTFCFTLGVRQRGANPGIGLAFGALACLLWPLGPWLAYYGLWGPGLLAMAFGPWLSCYGLRVLACLLWPLGPGLFTMAFGPWLACYGLWGPGLLAKAFGPWFAYYGHWALSCLLWPLGPWLA